MTSTGRRIRKHKLKAEINVVPYIDVMLVLLIIFMVTAPLLNLSVDVDLPKSNAKSIQGKKDPVIVKVDAAGNYFLVKEGKSEPLSGEALAAKVGAFVRNNKDVPVFVAGDAKANYAIVYGAMVLLQGAGVEKVGLLSDQAEAGKQ
ncbi:MAG TPA: protein TolR [Luteimonas sp.]|nr:protein TolR [Luteimonas sp.]